MAEFHIVPGYHNEGTEYGVTFPDHTSVTVCTGCDEEVIAEWYEAHK